MHKETYRIGTTKWKIESVYAKIEEEKLCKQL